MFKTLVSNLRELFAFVLTLLLLLSLLSLLGNARVAEDPSLSTLVSVLTTLVTGAMYFVTAVAFAWFGVAITFPEANRFIQSTTFDKFWDLASEGKKMAASLIAVAVLALVAAICFSAAR